MTKDELKALVAEYRKKHVEMVDVMEKFLFDDDYMRIAGHLSLDDILDGIDPDWDRL